MHGNNIRSVFLVTSCVFDEQEHNMDAIDDKFDRHVSFLLQKFEGQRFPSILPRTCEETNVITSLLQEWQPDKQAELMYAMIGCVRVQDVLDTELRDKQAELQYEIIACVRVLDVLGIEDVTRETLRACLKVCTRASWRRAFLSGHLQKAKEFLLHVASIESLPRGFMFPGEYRVERCYGVHNETALSLLVPQIQNKNMIVCFLKIAKSTLNKEQICLISKLLNVEADSCFKQCIDRALRDGEWCVVDHMLRLYDMDKTTLHQVLVKAMKRREWKEVEACLELGADIATACTETGFDLNARSGESHRTVLHDAMFINEDAMKKIVQALLQAGADPNVRDSDGETVVCTAVNYRNWDFALLLLMHTRAAGTTVSHTFRNGEPVLHFVCKKGQSELVRELFTTQTDPLATDGKGNTLIMAALGGADSKNVCRDYFSEPEPISPGSKKENVMRVLIQLGVATHQALLSQSQLRSLKQKAQNVTVDSFQSPMWQAVKRRKLRIARMLYAAGACCNEEIHELVNSEFTGHKLEETNQRDIMDFLNPISSHPRSLRDICALTISHLIGCGPQRDERAASLGLPDSLRRRVLQDHVISSDFQGLPS